ncbi:MAG: hypothetical protein GXO76_02710 [Calditrichaeota bacterium]|nr:hypothetical protein [Calditrichota bacterium]
MRKNQPVNGGRFSGFGRSSWKNSGRARAVHQSLFLLIIFWILVPASGLAQFRSPAGTSPPRVNAFPRDFFPGCSGDKWIANDKYRHFVGSAFAAASGYWMMRYNLRRPKKEAILFGGGFSFSLGLGKELRDKYFHAGCASWKDLTADLLGIAFGLIFYTETIRWQ